MIPHIPHGLPQSPIYKKAMEILMLSRHISNYLVQDLSAIGPHGEEDPHIYFTGDIVQQSVSLAPEILKAEQQAFSEEKYKYAASVNRLANALYKNCERLEGANSNGKEFLPILRNELKKFRKLQRTWMMTL
ncbi:MULTISPECIES: hypothetical protein [Altibacter]|uniref:hypothetical protein n=1 Tax=Altibacter TaxID=1535231 RepID=UPI00054E441B|nr:MULTISPECIES: hypothetical protein [Altibacter]MCW8979915.1 hypothetical protein [Altibacter sp.]MCW9037845.1 hypothetical protein [Altibacter sp.]